jgi:hypothetical protein
MAGEHAGHDHAEEPDHQIEGGQVAAVTVDGAGGDEQEPGADERYLRADGDPIGVGGGELGEDLGQDAGHQSASSSISGPTTVTSGWV